jgi:hypothetical protein
MTSRVFVVRRSPLARPLTAVIAAVLVSGALAGCTGFSIEAGCEPAFQPGDASDAITATGDVGDSPDVVFPTPLIAEETQRSVTTEGSGDAIGSGAAVLYDVVYYVGATGEALSESTPVLGVASDASLALGEALECATPGSRIVLAGPAEEIDAQYEGVTETLVAVIDVENVFLGKANGVNQLPQDGMPTVVTAVDGQPGVTLTYQEAPAETRAAVIKAGSGATVAEGDTIVYHGRNWSWPAGEGGTPTLGQLDTWTQGGPAQLDVDAESLSDEVVFDALRGAKVGSQLLLVIPNTSGDGGTSVVVLDILGILADE